jgi:hypothetical protein
MTNPKRLEEIRSRLAKATPGEWVPCEWDPMEPRHILLKSKEHGPICTTPNFCRSDDLALCANSPSDIAYLLSELDAALEVVKAARETCSCRIAYESERHEGGCPVNIALIAFDARPTEKPK